MSKSNDEILLQALDEFEEYLPGYLPAEESERAVSYVNQSMSSALSESKVRSLIKEAIIKLGDDAFDMSDLEVLSVIKYIRDDLKIDKFTPESGFESFLLMLDDTNAERVRNVMKNSIPKSLQTVTMEILSQLRGNINSALFSATPGERVIVPEELLPLAEYRSTRRGGSQTGAGELIVPFLFNDASVSVGTAPFDVTIGGLNWEVKAAKKSNGIKLGSAKGKKVLDGRLYKRLMSLGLYHSDLSDIGSVALKSFARDVVSQFSIKDDTGDVIETAERFLDVLSQDARDTALKDVEGIIWYHKGRLSFTPKERLFVKRTTQGRYVVYEKAVSAN